VVKTAARGVPSTTNIGGGAELDAEGTDPGATSINDASVSVAVGEIVFIGAVTETGTIGMTAAP